MMAMARNVMSQAPTMESGKSGEEERVARDVARRPRRRPRAAMGIATASRSGIAPTFSQA